MSPLVQSIVAYLLILAMLRLATRRRLTEHLRRQWHRPWGLLARLAVVIAVCHLFFHWIGLPPYLGYGIIAILMLASVCIFVSNILGVIGVLLFDIFYEWVLAYPSRHPDPIESPPDRRHELTGKCGTVTRDLTPAGRIDVDGIPYDARASSGFIARGTPVRIVGHTNFEYIVEKQPEP